MDTVALCSGCGQKLMPAASPGLCPDCLAKSALPTQSGKPPESSVTSLHGFQAPKPEDLAPHFPQLEILEFIGRGGMGAVFKARQPGLDRLVALKILAAQAASGSGFAERFTREARALAKLNHPNIVTVYDFGQADGMAYFVMEYVDGPNLKTLERSGKLGAREALQIAPQICAALQFAHDEGIIHRDIKPDNILLDKRGRVKIADFGIAKILGQTPQDGALTGVGDVMGTRNYMAPEQIEKPQDVDHRADIFALGVVLYELLTGELPLGRFAPPSQRTAVDVRLDKVVLRALEKEPDRRYQHASELKADLDTIATTQAIPPLAASTPPPLIHPRPATGATPPTTPRFQPASQGSDGSDRRILPALILGFFFGVLGAHRFYAGKIGTGLAQLFTLGGLGIWMLIDVILIVFGAFTDKEGKRITQWI